MKMIFKNFAYVLKKFKTSSLLNILGLSAAFAVFLALMTQVYYDLSFNKHVKDANDIYLLDNYSHFTGMHSYWFSVPLGESLREKVSLVESLSILSHTNTGRYYAEGADENAATEERILKVRGDFISVFNPTVLEGNLSEAIAEGTTVAISESTAKKIFGDVSALDKILVNYYNQKRLTIKAVVKDFPKNSTFKNGVFEYLPEQPASESSYHVFMKIAPENVKLFQEFLKTDEFMGEGSLKYIEEHPEQKQVFSVIPFSDIHLKYPAMGSGDWNITIALLAIAILTLAIAYINFINFSLAMAPSRVKALTLQRVLGLNKNVQLFLVAVESALFSLIAFGIGLLLVNFVASSTIAELFSADLRSVTRPNVLLLGSLLTLLVGFIIGIYPARYITRFNVVESIKGTSVGSTKGTSKLRSILITFQFAATIMLIIITVSIKLQYDYMVNYSWGIEKENIVYMNAGNTGINYKVFSEELLKDPRIVEHTRSQFTPGYVTMGWGRHFCGKQITLQSWPVADNYLDFFGAKIIVGNNFTGLENPEKKKLIFNEEFLRKYEFKPEEVLGKEMFVFEDDAEVVGIAKDINFETLKMAIRPMAFVTIGDDRNNILFFKLSGNDTRGALQLIEDTWKRHTKEVLKLEFLSERLEGLYRSESNLGKLVGLFSVVTILIAIMGVYGLIAFNIKYRRKEIAVRKINGASEFQVVKLINRNMIIQVLIGFIIASPFAYWVVDKWLSSFAYRIDIQWWVFPLSGIFVLFVALVAVSWQSYSAAISNPVESLKSE